MPSIFLLKSELSSPGKREFNFVSLTIELKRSEKKNNPQLHSKFVKALSLCTL
jgi:hypothetical protein